VWCCSLNCARETVAGELCTGIPDCLNDLAPAEESLPTRPAPTPQEQQHVEEAQGKNSVSNAQPTAAAAPRIADPAGLPETGNGIGDSGSSKYSNEVSSEGSGGDETYRGRQR